ALAARNPRHGNPPEISDESFTLAVRELGWRAVAWPPTVIERHSELNSFDHLVGAAEQRQREAEAEPLGGLEIEHQITLTLIPKPSPRRHGRRGSRPSARLDSRCNPAPRRHRASRDWGAKRHIEIKPGYKVRVADEGLAKRDEIGAPLRDGLVGAHFVEAVIGHEEPAEEPLDRQIVKGRNRGPARVALDHMKISETSTRQCRGDVVEEALRIAVSDVVLPVLRRDAHAGALGTNRSGHRVDDLEQEPHAVLDAASISVRALVGTVAQELIDQISVRAMYLDTVEAGRKRVPRSLRILRNDAGDLGCLKRAWRGGLFEAVCREGFCVRPNGGR